MVRSFTFAAALTLIAGAAQAGGLAPCAITGTCGNYAGNAPGVYVQNDTVVVESVRVSAATRTGTKLLCPYPHRPSDGVFIGGAGYLTKDQVRRAMGCR